MIETNFSKVSRHDTLIKPSSLGHVRGLTTSIQAEKCTFKFQSTSGSIQVKVDLTDQKFRLKDMMRKLSDDAEFKKDNAKSIDVRKLVVRILRY